jgi:hypothetical protein
MPERRHWRKDSQLTVTVGPARSGPTWATMLGPRLALGVIGRPHGEAMSSAWAVADAGYMGDPERSRAA